MQVSKTVHSNNIGAAFHCVLPVSLRDKNKQNIIGTSIAI